MTTRTATSRATTRQYAARPSVAAIRMSTLPSSRFGSSHLTHPVCPSSGPSSREMGTAFHVGVNDRRLDVTTHDVIPTSEDVTIAIVRSLFDGDFPIKHLRAIMTSGGDDRPVVGEADRNRPTAVGNDSRKPTALRYTRNAQPDRRPHEEASVCCTQHPGPDCRLRRRYCRGRQRHPQPEAMTIWRAANEANKGIK